MKKSIWNKGIFAEGLRRMRGRMITFSVLNAVFTAVMTVIMLVVGTSGNANYLGYLLTWPIIAFVFIGAPALAFKAFSFLNKRGGSDVYHALPYTRTCVFISVLSSLFTGIAAVTAVSGVTAVIAYFIVGGDMEFLYATVLIILYCFLSAVFSSSVAVAAICASGSVFTELVMSGVILIFPQVLIYIVRTFINSNIYTARYGGMFIAYSMSTPDFDNLPLRLFMAFFGGYYPEDLYKPFALIYSAVVCVLYLTGAYFLFRYRKSETAGRSAPTNLVQAIFRVILACAFSFIGTLTLLFGKVDDDVPSSYLPLVIVMFSIAAIAYFIFELISTKGKRNILKALPGFAAVIALNFAFAGVTYGVYSYEFNYGTDPVRVDSMAVSYREVSYDTETDLIEVTNRRCAENGYELKGEEAIKAVCGNIAYANKSKNSSYNSSTAMRFKIRCGIVTKVRALNVFDDVSKLIENEIKQSETYKTLLMQIPDQSDIENMYTDYPDWVYGVYEGRPFSVKGDTKTKKVLDALQNDLKDVDFEEWQTFLKGVKADKGIYVQYHMKYGYLKIPLSETLTPSACSTALKEAGLN